MLKFIMEARLPELWKQQEELFRRGEKEGNSLIGLRAVVFLENMGDLVFFSRRRIERTTNRVEKLRNWLNLE